MNLNIENFLNLPKIKVVGGGQISINARIVIDRFHVQKLINKNLNKIRLTLEVKGLKNKILLMMAQSKLTELEKTELEILLRISPTLRIAHELKEDILEIYKSNITPLNAIRQMKKQMQSR